MVNFVINIIDGIKSIGKYLLENESVMSLLGVFLGWQLNNYSNNKLEKKREQEKIRLEKQKYFENKPELYIEQNDEELEVNVEVFVGTFDVKYDEKKNYEIVYSKDICNKKKHAYKDVVIKNIGKSDIEGLYITSADKRRFILTSYASLNFWVKQNDVYFSECYDRKIRPGEKIKIRFYYLKGKEPNSVMYATLLFLFVDSNHNYWEQPYFYDRDNVYSSHGISYKKFRNIVTSNDVYDCFENPYLW